MRKLDPRIKDRKYIFDCFNADEAKKYIGKLCYMTDYLNRFEDVESTAKCILHKIEDSRKDSGTCAPFVECDFRFSYCLPAEFVAPKVKIYRPYTLAEFCSKFTIGRPINFRKKDNVGNEQYLILNGYITVKEFDRTVHYICIGSTSYILNELFNEYEWQELSTKEWKLFGVEE